MNAQQHYREAEQRLDQAHGADPEFAAYLAAKAQAHATLALFDLLREIGDQLDTAAVVRHVPPRSLCEPANEVVECCASGSCEVCKR